MSANRANIAWHLANMIAGGGIVAIPKLGEKGFAPGAVAIKSTGTFGNGIYINQGTFDSCNFVSTDGLSAILSGGSEQDPYEISTTQNYLAGSRAVLYNTGVPRTFYYAKATNTIANIRQGVMFYNAKAAGVSYVAATAGVIGDTTITITAANITLNQLRGGHLVIHTHSDKKHQFFGIVGNTATNAAGTITISLDGKLTHTITSSHGVEVWLNPYTSVRLLDPSLNTSVAGIPVRHTTVDDTWLWLQTWGPCWANTYGSIVEGERRLVFDRAGNVCAANDNRDDADDDAFQRAGYILDRLTTGNGMFMLEVTP